MGFIFGIRGRQGDDGEQGIQGDVGEQGIQGIQGIQGEQGIAPSVDRGRIAEHDYVKDDFDIDGNWHELDLSGIVGEGRRLVLLYIELKSLAASNQVFFMSAEGEPSLNRIWMLTQVANRVIANDRWVYTDENGIVKYNIQDVVWTTINVSVRNWFVCG